MRTFSAAVLGIAVLGIAVLGIAVLGIAVLGIATDTAALPLREPPAPGAWPWPAWPLLPLFDSGCKCPERGARDGF